jgi:hypothetical protein
MRRLAAATVICEELEGKAVNGEPLDLSTFCQLASTTVRLASRLGVERVPRDVTPSLSEILQQSDDREQQVLHVRDEQMTNEGYGQRDEEAAA